jgi:hypothetical protein
MHIVSNSRKRVDFGQLKQGHIVPFELTRYLSDVFQAPLIIML